MKVALLDYGRGNLRSVERALATAGAEVTRVENPKGLPGMSCLVVAYRDWETDRKSTRLNSSH